MPARRTPKQNHLLAALPAADLLRLLPHLELVPLPLGAVIYESGGEQAHVYFPTSGIVSLLYVMEDGASAEIAVVGNEGVVGIVALHGRRDHAQPRGGAERGQRLPPASRPRSRPSSTAAARCSTCCCATPRR